MFTWKLLLTEQEAERLASASGVLQESVAAGLVSPVILDGTPYYTPGAVANVLRLYAAHLETLCRDIETAQNAPELVERAIQEAVHEPPPSAPFARLFGSKAPVS